MVKYNNAHSRRILGNDRLKKLLKDAYCWDCHVKGDSSNLKTILYVMTGHLGSWSNVVTTLLRKYLNEKGIKGVNRFKMPEIITWCGCEPQCSKFREAVREFYSNQ